jgi:hypothetical protein
MSINTSQRMRIGALKTPSDATAELERVTDCLASQGYSIHLYACSAPILDYNRMYSSQRRQAEVDKVSDPPPSSDPVQSLALHEFSSALATSTFRALMLAVNSAGVPVRGWLSASFEDTGTMLQHLWADESTEQWLYYEEDSAYTCTVQRALLDVFRLLLWRSHLEGLLAPTNCLVFRSSEADAEPVEHLADAPLMLGRGKDSWCSRAVPSRTA